MLKNNYYLGIDVGSITIKAVVIDSEGKLVSKTYERSDGDPISKLKKHLNDLDQNIKKNIAGVGVTGSGRNLASIYIGADLVIDEITAQAVAVSKYHSDARTVIEIGGQDSKIILLKAGIVKNFAMNTVCAAGTGAFLDQQAHRLKIKIEDFGLVALKSKNPTKIAGRCTIFAETDMIHKQQIGLAIEDILAGLCHSLARNFFHAVAKNIEVEPPVIFQGGVAANIGMIQAFNKSLKTKVVVPENFKVMPALGAALLVMENAPRKTKFKGIVHLEAKIKQKIWRCDDCSNNCELIDVLVDEKKISTTGSVCGKHV